MPYKATAALRARTSSVADVMLDFLEGLVFIFMFAMHCNITDNPIATYISDMAIAAV
jgi:hypothetical protein